MKIVKINFCVITRDENDRNPADRPDNDPRGPALPPRVVSPISCHKLWKIVKNIGESNTREVSDHTEEKYQEIADKILTDERLTNELVLESYGSGHIQSGGVWYSGINNHQERTSYLYRINEKGPDEGDDPTVYKVPLGRIGDTCECHYVIAITDAEE